MSRSQVTRVGLGYATKVPACGSNRNTRSDKGAREGRADGVGAVRCGVDRLLDIAAGVPDGDERACHGPSGVVEHPPVEIGCRGGARVHERERERQQRGHAERGRLAPGDRSEKVVRVGACRHGQSVLSRLRLAGARGCRRRTLGEDVAKGSDQLDSLLTHGADAPVDRRQADRRGCSQLPAKLAGLKILVSAGSRRRGGWPRQWSLLPDGGSRDRVVGQFEIALLLSHRRSGKARVARGFA